MKKISLLFLLLLTLISCNNKQKQPTATLNNQCAITLPTFLVENKELNLEGVLEYTNDSLQIYFALSTDNPDATEHGIREDLSVLTDYCTFWLNHYLKEFVQVNNITKETLTINGLPAQLQYIDGVEDTQYVTMMIGCIQGTKGNYLILCTYPFYNDMDLKALMGESVRTFVEL